MTELGKRILALRKRRGFSQDELAGMLGITRPAVSEIERGSRRVTAEELVELARIFETSVDYILGLTGEPVVELESGGAAPPPGKQKRDVRISVPQKHLQKFKEVLLYILARVGARPNVGETVIYKLLYFIDFDYYEKYEEQLIGATYRKNIYGPTPLEFEAVVEDMVKNGELDRFDAERHGYRQKRYLARRRPDLRLLNGAEIETIDAVIRRVGGMGARQVSEYSHGDVPWLTTPDGEEINYESVFYRAPAYSVRDDDGDSGDGEDAGMGKGDDAVRRRKKTT
jgi:transcriptional regulator with XRE-family HTH domain